MLKTYFSAACLALTVLFTSCDEIEKIILDEPKEETYTGFTTYVIPENNHYTNNNIGLVTSNKLKFIVKFDKSAVYITKDKGNQADINKLYGFSDCGSDHQSNSARFGWRWYNNQLEILAYTYKNQTRNEEFITAVELNKEYEYELEALDGKYVFKLDGKTVEMERGCSGNSNKYKLFPYFGGDETAPHNITILIKELQ
ncbi:hypothetical protein [Adhaeribacter radiodurans]|uniref:Lipoprotein n=1 Tax=Adhaeribacter radiodurans TaxID=2745197 RepID=A0A7L7L621_9BACT|nr:hypothetical protein [Adhaeribacter radiodurans]QMU28276.1 hypothetical protein HUW48_09620 [Adhaeribacter radiodurans]